MAKLSVADIQQMYLDNIVSYKGEFVKVKAVSQDAIVTYIKLSNGRNNAAEFNRELFIPPRNRLGYINHNGHAVYVSRLPLRRYGVGINKHNVLFKSHEAERGRGTLHRCIDQLIRCDSASWDNTLNNVYPSLRDALRVAADLGSSCAFDRQFAVDSNRNVFYKSIPVGSIAQRYYSPSRISFDENYSYLSVLMELNNEATKRTFEAA